MRARATHWAPACVCLYNRPNRSPRSPQPGSPTKKGVDAIELGGALKECTGLLRRRETERGRHDVAGRRRAEQAGMNGWLCLRTCHLLSWLFIDITQVRATACQTAARPRTTHAHYLSSPSLSWLLLWMNCGLHQSSSGFAAAAALRIRRTRSSLWAPSARVPARLSRTQAR